MGSPPEATRLAPCSLFFFPVLLWLRELFSDRINRIHRIEEDSLTKAQSPQREEQHGNAFPSVSIRCVRVSLTSLLI